MDVSIHLLEHVADGMCDVVSSSAVAWEELKKDVTVVLKSM